MVTKNPERHYETPDPNPVRIPAGFKRPETLEEQIRRLVRSERFAVLAQEEGFETFDEADDFDVDDDLPDPGTPYETFFDPALGREVTPADVIDEKKRGHYAAQTEKRVKPPKAAPETQSEPPATPPTESAPKAQE